MRPTLNSLLSFFADMTETVVVSFSVWLVMYLFFMQPTLVIGSSMEPTFSTQQCVMTDKVSYRLGEPKRGDVVSLHMPESAHCVPGGACELFKRIIGLPGEQIAVTDGSFFINGERLVEDYIPLTTRTLSGRYLKDTPVVLASDEYFVAGDNREHSSDSRAFGPIKRTDIMGKAFFRFCPLEDLGPLQQVSY